MVNVVLQFVHFGFGSLSKMCLCVRYVCPVLSLVMALSCCLEFRLIDLQGVMWGCMSLSAV